MSAGYVPQVGDTAATGSRTIEGVVIAIDGGDVGIRVTNTSRPSIAIGACLWMPLNAEWVKVDKPEPWPVMYHAVSRKVGWLGLSSNLQRAIDLAGALADDVSVRIWRSNSDGSVTVLDHTGAELP